MEPHVHPIDVTADAIDTLGHVNNVEYVRWMQDAALEHATALGATAAALEDGSAWVARSHHIEYLRPAFEGERIEVRTWIADVKRVSSVRRYEFVRGTDVVARGETEWIYVDLERGRPRSIPAHVRSLLPEFAEESK